jgi:hypothetical protein
MESDRVQLTWSSANSPDPHWACLHSLSADRSTTAIPLPVDRRIWITRLLGAGSTGGVYEGSLGGVLFAVKVVEILGSPEDVAKRQRLRREFDMYARVERAYHSGELAERFAPRFFGAFRSKRMDALIMELHGDALSDWNDLSLLEW